MLVKGAPDIDGIPPKGPYPPCLRMADRALLAGYPRYELNAWVRAADADIVWSTWFQATDFARIDQDGPSAILIWPPSSSRSIPHTPTGNALTSVKGQPSLRISDVIDKLIYSRDVQTKHWFREAVSLTDAGITFVDGVYFRRYHSSKAYLKVFEPRSYLAGARLS